MQSVYEAAGGDAGLLRLAAAWHGRVMTDEVVSHAFTHGFHPRHTERLAAYWAEALGGPTTFSDSYGDESSVVAMHSGNGPHEEMDRRAIGCFDQALTDVGLAENSPLRLVLHDYFAWATTTTMSRYHGSADDVPSGLSIPRWSWDGLQSADRAGGELTKWVERDRARVWHGFTQMASFAESSPVMVERAEGRELIDVAGRRYLDAISSLWVTTLGHRIPELDHALQDQLGRVAHSTLLGNGNVAVVELAEALAEVVPVDDARFLFASDGAAAVEQALKIAFQFWWNQGITTRTQYLCLGDAYHGDTVGSLSLGGGGFGTDLFDALRFPGVVRVPGYRCADWLDGALDALTAHAGLLAAAVIEPLVQGAAGMLVALPEEVRRFGQACQEAGVLLICDEVATGFGRTGSLFASERCALRPDLLCLGKGLAGGYLPMSVTVASGRVADAFLGEDLGPATLYHGHSFGGNALAAAVARRHLELIDEWQVLDNVAARAGQLEKRLAGLSDRPAVAGVRSCGLMAGVELATPAPDRRWGRRVCAAALEAGVLLRPLGEVVVLMPILTTTAAEIDRIVDVLEAAIDTACR